MQFRNRTIRWVAMAALVTCGTVAVPQAAFAAAKAGASVEVAGTSKAKDSKDSKDTKQAKDARQAKDAKQAKAAKRAKNAQRAKDAKDTRQAKVAKDAKQAKHAKGKPRAADTKHATQSKKAGDSKGFAGPLTVAAVPASPESPSIANCVETYNVAVSAVWSIASIEDHADDTLDVTLTRPTSNCDINGLGYTITLPTGTYRSYGSIDNECSSGPITGGVGATTFTVTGATILDGQTTCVIKFPVTSGTSGQYVFDTAKYSSLAGTATNQTPQTLTVTTAPPRVGANFSPTSIAALSTTTLTVTLNRSDENGAAVSSGLGYQLNLPAGLIVTNGPQTNTCGGNLTAAGGATYATLSGGTLTGQPASCEVTFTITSTESGEYELDNAALASPAGVRARLASNCAEAGRTEGGCSPTLTVNKVAQTITFTQPADASVSQQSVPLTATASSSLTVTFASTTAAVCTVNGGTVTLLAAGTCTILANQAGNGAYDVAGTQTRSFTVGPPTPAPTQVVATAGVAQISVQWQAPGDTTGITGYIATATPGQASCSTSSASGTSCVMGGVAGTTYTVKVVTKSSTGNSAATAPSNEVTPTAPPISTTVPDTNLTLTTDKGLITTAVPSQDIVVIGTGFMAYSTAKIIIYSLPIDLGSAVTDGAGNFSKPVTVPADLVVGGHTLVASGVDPGGAPHSLKMAIRVAAAAAAPHTSPSSGSLAVTGVRLTAMLQLGLAAMFTGSGLLLAGRTRRRVA